MKLKAVFLDKDGTIIGDLPENVNNAKTDLNETVVEGLQLLQSNGYLLVMVSNKSGKTESYLPRVVEEEQEPGSALDAICSKMGIYLDGVYYAPAEPKVLEKASKDMDIDLSESWMIGDIISDIELGKTAGCKTILIGNEDELKNQEAKVPEYQAKNLAEAARYIVG